MRSRPSSLRSPAGGCNAAPSTRWSPCRPQSTATSVSTTATQPLRLDRRSRPHHRKGQSRVPSDGVKPYVAKSSAPHGRADALSNPEWNGAAGLRCRRGAPSESTDHWDRWYCVGRVRDRHFSGKERSSETLAGGSSKLETVTPSSRMPLAVGRSPSLRSGDTEFRSRSVVQLNCLQYQVKTPVLLKVPLRYWTYSKNSPTQPKQINQLLNPPPHQLFKLG